MMRLSKTSGTGGTIKNDPESFVVEEITGNGTVLALGKTFAAGDLGEETDAGGKFTRFVMQKRNWNTIGAMKEIVKRFGRGIKSAGYAGMKDKISVSTQLASAFGITPEEILKINAKDITINGAWRSKEGVKIGGLLGNRFGIIISDAENPDNAGKVFEELDLRMPNYFDKQRFGYRLNNFRIGLHIMRGEFEDAVMDFLTCIDNESNEDANAARISLRESMDFKKAISEFPRFLNGERTVLDYLAKYPTNYANAINALPRGLSIMFIHAVEDALFNFTVESQIKNGGFDDAVLRCGTNFYGFPDISTTVSCGSGDGRNLPFPVANIVGYETREEYLSGYEKEALDRIGVTKEMFRVKRLPHLGMRGSFRPLLSTFVNPLVSREGNGLRVGFSCPSGTYATILMDEIIKARSIGLNAIAPELASP